MAKFKVKVIEDNKQINKVSSKIGNLSKYLNEIKDEFIRYFGYFDLNDMEQLIKAADKASWIEKKYIEVKKINVGAMNLKTAINLNLIEVPDTQKLIALISNYNHALVTIGGGFVNSIKEFYSSEQKAFANPFVINDNSKIEQRIIKHFSIKTENETENILIEELDIMATIYTKMLNEYRIIKPVQVPLNLFRVEVMSGGYKAVTVLPHVLQKFRALHQKPKTQGEVVEID